jgi:hypothetical protein
VTADESSERRATMDGITDARARTLRRHIATAASRDRVARALYESIVDGLEFGPRGVATADDREWIRGALSVWLHETADAALDLAAWRMSTAFDDAPNGLGQRYDRSHEWEELGWD